MRIVLCGVRGSTPAPGPAFTEVGGNTSCVALIAHGATRPTLVLDAGTGLAAVANLLDGHPFRGTILLGHLHWDHTHGLPFFPAADRPDACVTVRLPAQGEPAIDLIARFMSPPSFPIDPLGLRGDWTFENMDEGVHEVEEFDVLAREIPHKGGRTFGFRVTDGAGTFTYMSDHGPLAAYGPGPDGWGEYHAAALDLCAGSDVLVHDAQYTSDELSRLAPFGHANGEDAVELARRTGVPRVLLFHHAPGRTDDQVADIAACLHTGDGPVVEAAREGIALDLEAVGR